MRTWANSWKLQLLQGIGLDANQVMGITVPRLDAIYHVDMVTREKLVVTGTSGGAFKHLELVPDTDPGSQGSH